VKAYQLMMFMLLFSLSISVVNVLHIYNMENVIDPENVDTTYNVADYEASVDSNAVVMRFFGDLIEGLVLGGIAATIISYFTKIPSDAAFAYGIFGGTYFGFAKNALGTIWSIQPGNEGIMVIVFIFAVALGAVFITGILQLIRGGWEAYS